LISGSKHPVGWLIVLIRKIDPRRTSRFTPPSLLDTFLPQQIDGKLLPTNHEVGLQMLRKHAYAAKPCPETYAPSMRELPVRRSNPNSQIDTVSSTNSGNGTGGRKHVARGRGQLVRPAPGCPRHVVTPKTSMDTSRPRCCRRAREMSYDIRHRGHTQLANHPDAGVSTGATGGEDGNDD
jgi:hypothetical protein